MSKKRVAVSLRKPQTRDDVEAFVEGQGVVPPPASASAVLEKPIEAAPVVQHGAGEYREMTLYLPVDVARQLSLYCMERDCDVSRVVADAVSKHVAGAEPARVMHVPGGKWSGAVEAVVEQLRVRVSAVWALRN
jgi:hypothetical protein